MPFDAVRYQKLMDGLEAVEMRLSVLKLDSADIRIDSDFYKKEYRILNEFLKSKNAIPLKAFLTTAVMTGHTPSMSVSDYYGGTVKFIKTDNLRDNEIRQNFNHYLSNEGAKQLVASSLKKGDIITTIIGATHEVIARTCLVSDDILPANINQNIALIRTDQSKILPEYLTAYLNSKYGKNYLRYLSRQMGQVNLNCPEVEKVLVVVSEWTFQQQIRKLYHDSKRLKLDSNELYYSAESLLLSELGLSNWQPTEANTEVKTFSQSFAASGRLDAEYYQPKYDKLIKKLEASGEAVQLQSVLSYNQRGTQPEYVEENGIPVLNSKHIRANKIDWDDTRLGNPAATRKENTIRFGDVLINGTGVGTIGRTAPYLKEQPALPDNHVTILRCSDMDPVFLSVQLNSIVGQLQVEKFFKSSSGQIELYPADIAQFTIWKRQMIFNNLFGQKLKKQKRKQAKAVTCLKQQRRRLKWP